MIVTLFFFLSSLFINLPSWKLCYDWWPRDLRRNVSKWLLLAGLLAGCTSEWLIFLQAVVFKSALSDHIARRGGRRGGLIFIPSVNSGRNPNKKRCVFKAPHKSFEPRFEFFSLFRCFFCIDPVAFLDCLRCHCCSHRCSQTRQNFFPSHFVPIPHLLRTFGDHTHF